MNTKYVSFSSIFSSDTVLRTSKYPFGLTTEKNTKLYQQSNTLKTMFTVMQQDTLVGDISDVIINI